MICTENCLNVQKPKSARYTDGELQRLIQRTIRYESWITDDFITNWFLFLTSASSILSDKFKLQTGECFSNWTHSHSFEKRPIDLLYAFTRSGIPAPYPPPFKCRLLDVVTFKIANWSPSTSICAREDTFDIVDIGKLLESLKMHFDFSAKFYI